MIRQGCLLILALFAGCTEPGRDQSVEYDARQSSRLGEEIVVAGHLIHIGTPVVLWTDPGGYDAYTANHFTGRDMRGDPDSFDDLRHHIDQFVLHYDAAGCSQQCFKVLHEIRGLSVHFLLDIDGTIYQTLDLKERAWHATIANNRSIGIEIANIGAYPIVSDPADRVTTAMVESSPLAAFYARDKQGYFLTLPGWMDDPHLRTPGFLSAAARPSRPEPISGTLHGQILTQFDFTDAQYSALTKLTAALCETFPELACDFPRRPDGAPLDRALTPPELLRFKGLLGHCHVQANKVDPGPAFDWKRVIEGARNGRR